MSHTSSQTNSHINNVTNDARSNPTLKTDDVISINELARDVQPIKDRLPFNDRLPLNLFEVEHNKQQINYYSRQLQSLLTLLPEFPNSKMPDDVVDYYLETTADLICRLFHLSRPSGGSVDDSPGNAPGNSSELSLETEQANNHSHTQHEIMCNRGDDCGC